MRRLRRRFLFAVPLALAIALVSGSPARDASSTLRTRGEVQVIRSAVGDGLGVAPKTQATSAPVPGLPAVTAVAAPGATAIKTAPQRFSGAAPRRAGPPAALDGSSVSAQSARSGGTWAVVVGVNDYPGTENDLTSAVNDANDVAQGLGILGVAPDHILVLRDGQVNSGSLLRAVSWLANRADRSAVAGFFFAGHVRKTAAGDEEIVTSDGSSVTDHQLARALDRVQAARSWVAIAACYGLGFDEAAKPGRVITGAAGRNSIAYENSVIGRSYMVEYMVRQAIVQGRASATVQTAFNYAVDRISREHPGREPAQIDHSDGALDLRPPGANRSSEPQPPPEPEPQPTPPPAEEPPASDRPPSNGSQHCYTRGLIRYCSG